jgi:hypothetical protein
MCLSAATSSQPRLGHMFCVTRGGGVSIFREGVFRCESRCKSFLLGRLPYLIVTAIELQSLELFLDPARPSKNYISLNTDN